MKAIPYLDRVLLGAEIPSEGQFQVIRRIPQFRAPETFCPSGAVPSVSDTIRAAVFNMEHGYRIREIIPFLRECPDLKGADLIFGNELDDGTKRSGNIDASREIADALGFHYAYALEFIELADPGDRKGYEGNTLFSRWPIVRAESLYVPEGYNWYFDEQKRIGGRVALFCELDVAGKRLGAVCVHLENRTTSGMRAEQAAAIFRKANEMFGDMPILIGGDFNTNAFDYGEASVRAAFERQKDDGIIVDPSPFELLFSTADTAGFDWRSCNGHAVPTRRRPTGDGVLQLHLDWIFSRAASCVRYGMISTLLRDCSWADAQSPLRRAAFSELSDHNVVWADFRF